MAYDFALTIVSPTHVTRGRTLYGYVYGSSQATHPGETVNLSSSSPVGLSVSWLSTPPRFWLMDVDSTSMQAQFQVTAAVDASLGAATVTLIGTSTPTGTVHTIDVPVIVEDVPAALPAPEFDASYPISPTTLGVWEAGMVANAGAASTAADPNLTWGDTVNIPLPDASNAGQSGEDSAWYYDGIRVFHQIAAYTGDTSWYSKSDNVRSVYLTYLTGNPTPPGRRVFSKGFAMDAARRNTASQEHSDDLTALGWLAAGDSNNPQGTWQQVDMRSMREVAYALEANVDAILLGVTPFTRWTEYIDNALGMLDGWCRACILPTTSVDPNYPGYFVEPFMGGLSALSLIRYYGYTVSQGTPDTRVPVVVKAFGDWMMGQGADQTTKTDLEMATTLHEYDTTWHYTRYALRSVALPFVATDVGKSLRIDSGTGWTPGYWTITNPPDDSGWVMIRDINGPKSANTIPPAALGTTGGTGCIEEWNAWSPACNSWAYKIHYQTAIVSRDNLANPFTPAADHLAIGAFENPGGSNVPLNSIIVAVFGWLYKMYGETNGSQYRIFGDKVFNSSFATSRVPWTGKEFSQTYRNSFDYVAWRQEATMAAGSICWGRVTGVQEGTIHTFVGNWTGTGEVVGSGDGEYLALDASEYMVSEVVNTGVGTVTLSENVYDTGDASVVEYRHGNTSDACQSASWLSYSIPFASDGFVQLRLSHG